MESAYNSVIPSTGKESHAQPHPNGTSDTQRDLKRSKTSLGSGIMQDNSMLPCGKAFADVDAPHETQEESQRRQA